MSHRTSFPERCSDILEQGYGDTSSGKQSEEKAGRYSWEAKLDEKQ